VDRRLEARVQRLSAAGMSLAMASLLLLAAAVAPLAAREKDKHSYGEGLIVNIPMPEPQVVQVVEDVVQNGVIRGTREYNKDEYVSGAKAVATSTAFPPWNEGGKVFYKIREHALDPYNFKAGGDLGTLAVRYVVQPQGEKNTVLRIDAVFAPEYRHTVHPSDGTVESSEYKSIRDHLDAIEQMERQNVEAAKEREAQLQRKAALAMQPGVDRVPAASPHAAEASSASGSSVAPQSLNQAPAESTAPPASFPSGPTLEEHVKDLRRQVERMVKAPGAPLKSAPFHTASTLQSLNAGTEVLILISTPYWFGVETRKGQRGWILRDQLELP
jgi:hypothetical protein